MLGENFKETKNWLATTGEKSVLSVVEEDEMTKGQSVFLALVSFSRDVAASSSLQDNIGLRVKYLVAVIGEDYISNYDLLSELYREASVSLVYNIDSTPPENDLLKSYGMENQAVFLLEAVCHIPVVRASQPIVEEVDARIHSK